MERLRILRGVVGGAGCISGFERTLHAADRFFRESIAELRSVVNLLAKREMLKGRRVFALNVGVARNAKWFSRCMVARE